MKDAILISEYLLGAMPIDNLKLQKLLYYSQAVHLVCNNREPLFHNKIEAWRYGPVVPDVYHKYKSYGFDIIDIENNDSNLEDMHIEKNELETLDMVLAYYGEMSSMQLVSRTHNEKPWLEVYEPSKKNKVITNESLYNYFVDVLDIE